MFKLNDIVILTNSQKLTIKKNLVKLFRTVFTLKSEQHQHSTRRNYLNVPLVKITYGSHSVTLCAIRD